MWQKLTSIALIMIMAIDSFGQCGGGAGLFSGIRARRAERVASRYSTSAGIGGYGSGCGGSEAQMVAFVQGSGCSGGFAQVPVATPYVTNFVSQPITNMATVNPVTTATTELATTLGVVQEIKAPNYTVQPVIIRQQSSPKYYCDGNRCVQISSLTDIPSDGKGFTVDIAVLDQLSQELVNNELLAAITAPPRQNSYETAIIDQATNELLAAINNGVHAVAINTLQPPVTQVARND